MDAIQLLTQQHRAVDTLFERFDKARSEEKRELLSQIAEMLTIHAQIEERHFYPFARQSGIQDLVEHSYEDHSEVKRMLAEALQLQSGDPRLDELCMLMKQSVQEHVQVEEGTLFVQIKQVASEDQLREVGEVMDRTAKAVPQQEVLRMARGEESSPPTQV